MDRWSYRMRKSARHAENGMVIDSNAAGEVARRRDKRVIDIRRLLLLRLQLQCFGSRGCPIWPSAP